ncbi:effector-associated constant component EACC1 [Amycolatopsis vastitatis]|uniref:Uncharacterized protein n=1 Tax=Amycolatopsis vastitatis TaxID=1905142 RepID=A0A229TJ88_9PSEU|nr:hypothetical protein [Amycolatopsis vastitatis]OXM71305.1 hypothetical protein CF165_02375 [Amycolatopsis vastitatis]
MSGTISITLPDADEELRRLGSWLGDEDELRGRVQLADAPIRSGQMGGVLEAVVVVVTSGTATALCNSLFGFLTRSREAKKVTLKVKNAAGAELELVCGTADDYREIAATLQQFLEGKA